MCASPSVTICNNYPLHLLWGGRRKRLTKVLPSPARLRKIEFSQSHFTCIKLVSLVWMDVHRLNITCTVSLVCLCTAWILLARSAWCACAPPEYYLHGQPGVHVHRLNITGTVSLVCMCTAWILLARLGWCACAPPDYYMFRGNSREPRFGHPWHAKVRNIGRRNLRYSVCRHWCVFVRSSKVNKLWEGERQ
jgi:hypothetical protein